MGIQIQKLLPLDEDVKSSQGILNFVKTTSQVIEEASTEKSQKPHQVDVGYNQSKVTVAVKQEEASTSNHNVEGQLDESFELPSPSQVFTVIISNKLLLLE